MRAPDYEFQVAASVLDRLLDFEPDLSRDPPIKRSEGVKRVRRAVQRDLENLLNARNTLGDLPDGFSELRHSVVSYGLPDFSSYNITSPGDQARLTGAIEAVIGGFEPRLTNVRVELLAESQDDRSLAFRIEGDLVIHPAVERVAFDAVMQLHNQAYVIRDKE